MQKSAVQPNPVNPHSTAAASKFLAWNLNPLGADIEGVAGLVPRQRGAADPRIVRRIAVSECTISGLPSRRRRLSSRSPAATARRSEPSPPRGHLAR